MHAKVHIEFKRVQTWLFSVPFLRAMIGANALLGEVLRKKLPELARSEEAWRLSPLDAQFPSADPIDPLGQEDDPAADAARGILSRDGGHFEALFSSGANEFARAAAALVRRELPGLRFSISIGEDDHEHSSAFISTELPVLAPCDWMGRGLASVGIRQGTERWQVSLEVSHRHEAARRVESKMAVDLASLLGQHTKLAQRERPKTFKELAAGEYLAVIHADGNDVGSGAKENDGQQSTFFHRNRVLLRAALKTAIDRCCDTTAKDRLVPLLMLMLGGDDVLVVCRASVAIPFIVDLCRELEHLQEERAGFRLTLGVGVVFSRFSVPFYHLHEVAEKLATSAKRKYRSLPSSEKASVVDWAVYTAAWADAPEQIRARDWLRGSGEDRRVLSRRPLIATGASHDCLQGLMASASQLERAPRSQLRYLVDQLARGRTLAELAFAELSPETRDALKSAGVSQVWERPDSSAPYLTSLLDLVEVFELPRLGRRMDIPTPEDEMYEEDGEQEVSHG